MSFIIKGGGVIINTSMAGNVQQATGGGAIDPATIGQNLTFWLDERGQEILFNDLTYWRNQGSRANVTASNFTGQNFFSETINGYPAALFDGSRFLSPGTLQELFSLDSYHIFAVAKIAAVDTNSVNTYSNDAIIAHTNARFGFFNFKSNNTMYSFHQTSGDGYGGTALFSVDTVAYDTPVLLETWYDGTNLNVRYGNGSVASVAKNDIDPTTNTYDFYIGRNAGGSTFLSGALATILIVSNSLDPSTQAGIRQYLGTKYGVSY